MYKYMELLSVINFIGLLYLLYVVHDLKNSLRSQTKTPETSSRKEEYIAADDVPVYRESPAASYNQEPDSLQRFFIWFARDWPLKVGALFILLGFIWLVTYAFFNNWIGPVGRIVFGIVVGSGILIWGAKRIKINVYQGEILTALGAGVILVSIASAQYLYNKMFPPIAALVLVTMVAGIVAYVSYRNNTVRLAILGYLIGAIAPMLTASPSTSVLGLFSYLFCLTVATIWLVRVTGWRVLMIIALFVIWLYSIPMFNMYISPTNLVYMRFFAVTFTIMFYVLSLSAFMFDKTAKGADAIVGTLIGLYALHWIMTIIPHEFQSLLCVVFAIGFMAGSYVVFRIKKLEYPVYLYTGVSILFLITATLIQFKGTVLPVVLSTEALSLVVFADMMYGSRMVRWMTFLFILPLLYSLPVLFDFSSTTESGTLIYINLTVYAAGIYLMKYAKQTNDEINFLAKILTVAGGIYSLIYLWVSMPYYIGYQDTYSPISNSMNDLSSGIDSVDYRQRLFIAHAITLTLYSLVGIGMYVYGMHEQRKLTRQFGLFLTIFVIGRLILVEVWDMQLPARIITFFVIGIIFIGSVFIRKSSHEIH